MRVRYFFCVTGNKMRRSEETNLKMKVNVKSCDTTIHPDYQGSKKPRIKPNSVPLPTPRVNAESSGWTGCSESSEWTGSSDDEMDSIHDVIFSQPRTQQQAASPEKE